MKSVFVLLVLLLCFSPAKAVVPVSATLDISFFPSFSTTVNMELRVNGNTGKLYFKTSDRQQWVLRDSAIVSASELEAFFEEADTAVLLALQADSSWRGLDGITIAAKMSIGNAQNNVRLWSPQRARHPEMYRLLDAFFALAGARLPKQEDALEDVQMYLDYPLIKLKSTAPLVYRIYGALSIDTQPLLQNFFSSIPDTAYVVLDLSNFHGMGRILDDDFKKFDRSHPHVIWIVPGYLDNYFRDLLSPGKQVETLEEALQRLPK